MQSGGYYIFFQFIINGDANNEGTSLATTITLASTKFFFIFLPSTQKEGKDEEKGENLMLITTTSSLAQSFYISLAFYIMALALQLTISKYSTSICPLFGN
jgi:hypothetical protein